MGLQGTQWSNMETTVSELMKRGKGVDTADEHGNENEEDGGKRNQRSFASRGVEQRHEAGGGKSWLS